MEEIMKIITLSIVAALSLGAGAVSAAERLNDAQYVALGRCAGLAEGLNQNADAWNAAFRGADRGRSTLARSRATERHDSARRSVRQADDHGRSLLAEELGDQCAVLAPSQS
jgi:hypothetical protein